MSYRITLNISQPLEWYYEYQIYICMLPFLFLQVWENIREMYARLVAQSCPTLWDPIDCSQPGTSRREYWSGLPSSPAGDLPDLGIEPMTPAMQVDSLSSEPPGKPQNSLAKFNSFFFNWAKSKKKTRHGSSVLTSSPPWEWHSWAHQSVWPPCKYATQRETRWRFLFYQPLREKLWILADTDGSLGEKDQKAHWARVAPETSVTHWASELKCTLCWLQRCRVPSMN